MTALFARLLAGQSAHQSVPKSAHRPANLPINPPVNSPVNPPADSSATSEAQSNHLIQPGSIRLIEAVNITTENFRPFGQVIWPQPDDRAFGPHDAQLQLQNGTPRFYIMQLQPRGRRFHHITCHQACTQCLGSLGGREWFMGVAPPSPMPLSSSPHPGLKDIQVFKIPGDCFIKLNIGTWHAGPYFEGEAVNFYNLELSDTNVVDHTTCDLLQTYGTQFEIV